MEPILSTMQPRAEEFLHLLNQIDERLKQRVKRHEGRGFMMRLDVAAKSDPVLARYRDELREFSELRNAIVHYREFPARVIAEPTEEVLARLRYISAQILNPPRLIPTFASKVKCFSAQDPLLDALRFMDQRGHSQVPVKLDSGLALLTAEGVGRWFASRIEVTVSDTPIREVLAHERPGAYIVMSAGETVENARRAFREQLLAGRRLRAILITKDGQPKGELLGIVTAADLLEHREQTANT